MSGTRMHGARRPMPGQTGVAVVTALLVVALATLAVTGVMWRQQVQARSVENQIALAETRWLARGAIDWARTMLIYGAMQSPARDDLGQFWAVPIAETKIADPESTGLAEGYLSGQISDEQGRFNLLDLAKNGQPVSDPVQIGKFERLLGALSLDGQLVDAVAAAIARTQPRIGTNGQTPALDLPMLVVEDLARVPGIDAGTIERLRPHVAFLPNGSGQPIQVNANTASAEVLYATIGKLSLQQAQALVTERQRRTYFNDRGDFQNVARSVGAQLDAQDVAGIGVQSNYFRLQGRIRYDRVLMNLQALVFRKQALFTQVLWQQEN